MQGDSLFNYLSASTCRPRSSSDIAKEQKRLETTQEMETLDIEKIGIKKLEFPQNSPNPAAKIPEASEQDRCAHAEPDVHFGIFHACLPQALSNGRLLLLISLVLEQLVLQLVSKADGVLRLRSLIGLVDVSLAAAAGVVGVVLRAGSQS